MWEGLCDITIVANFTYLLVPGDLDSITSTTLSDVQQDMYIMSTGKKLSSYEFLQWACIFICESKYYDFLVVRTRNGKFGTYDKQVVANVLDVYADVLNNELESNGDLLKLFLENVDIEQIPKLFNYLVKGNTDLTHKLQFRALQFFLNISEARGIFLVDLVPYFLIKKREFVLKIFNQIAESSALSSLYRFAIWNYIIGNALPCKKSFILELFPIFEDLPPHYSDARMHDLGYPVFSGCDTTHQISKDPRPVVNILNF